MGGLPDTSSSCVCALNQVRRFGAQASLPRGMWDPSSGTRDQTHVPWTGRGLSTMGSPGKSPMLFSLHHASDRKRWSKEVSLLVGSRLLTVFYWCTAASWIAFLLHLRGSVSLIDLPHICWLDLNASEKLSPSTLVPDLDPSYYLPLLCQQCLWDCISCTVGSSERKQSRPTVVQWCFYLVHRMPNSCF